MADSTSTIVAELLRRLNAQEFQPFSILLSDGSRHEVPTRDHCTVTRLHRRIELEYDDGKIVDVNPLHISRFEWRRPAA